jgi:hypothetical protein
MTSAFPLRIDELERHLGTLQGLAHVEREVQRICEELSIRPPSRADLVELAASLATLSGRIHQFDRLVRGQISGETIDVS